MNQPTMSKEHAKRVFDAAKRAVEVARVAGLPLEAAITDTAIQSGIPSAEIARMIEIMLDALAARRAVQEHGKVGA